MMKIKAFLSLILIAMAAIFAIQNAADVDVKFLFWSLSVPRAFLVVAMLVAGFTAGITISSISKLKDD